MALHWPVSYLGSLKLYKDKKGHIYEGIESFLSSSRYFQPPIPSKVSLFITILLQCLFFPWILWMISCNCYNPFHKLDYTLAYQMFTKCLDLTRIKFENWYIDVGLKFERIGHIITWCDQGYQYLVQHCLPSEDEDKVNTPASKKFLAITWYISSISQDFIIFQGKKNADKITYIQAYITEKSVSYQHHQAWLHIDNKKIGKNYQKSKENEHHCFQCTGSAEPAVENNFQIQCP